MSSSLIEVNKTTELKDPVATIEIYKIDDKYIVLNTTSPYFCIEGATIALAMSRVIDMFTFIEGTTYEDE